VRYFKASIIAVGNRAEAAATFNAGIAFRLFARSSRFRGIELCEFPRLPRMLRALHTQLPPTDNATTHFPFGTGATSSGNPRCGQTPSAYTCAHEHRDFPVAKQIHTSNASTSPLPPSSRYPRARVHGETAVRQLSPVSSPYISRRQRAPAERLHQEQWPRQTVAIRSCRAPPDGRQYPRTFANPGLVRRGFSRLLNQSRL